MPAIRPILYVVGLLLSVLAAAMMIPSLVDWGMGNRDWRAFATGSGITLFIAVALVLSCRPEGGIELTVRQTFVLTPLSWLVVCAFAALPFALADIGLGYTGAYFEAMSGLTTTGSTVLVGLDSMPPGILLWRAILQLLGGVGIIVMAVAILPFLRIGGMQLFRSESSDRSDKALPRVSQLAGAIIVAYLVLTILCVAVLWALGMSFFDAVCHGFSTFATGGFSTSDNSIGNFRNPGVEVAMVVFMLLGGMTMSLFVRLYNGDLRTIARDSQLRWYLSIFAAFTLSIALWQVGMNGAAPHHALLSSAFNVASILTTTGFASDDYTLWGSFPLACFFFLTFLGGMTGSTSGGIKTFRLQVFYSIARSQVARLTQPHRVIVPVFNGRPIAEAIVFSVLAFLTLYGLSFGVIALGLSAFGLDLVTSLSGAATALSNVGPGLGETIGPAGNFSSLPEGALWLLTFGMLLGRLELLTVMVLLSPGFWRS